MRVFVIGYPGSLGGACTELWHTLKLWRSRGLEVTVVPTWKAGPVWKAKLESIGCPTVETQPDRMSEVKNLAGSIVVSFCNSEFLVHARRFREVNCKLVWANCMTFLFELEKRFYADDLFDAFVFQSEFQKAELEPQLERFGYEPKQGHLIRGAFDFHEFEFNPRLHAKGDVFVVGRMARPDLDKWSSNTWPIYSSIQYANKRALMLGMDDRLHQKLGPPPLFADCLKPNSIGVNQFLRTLHCLLPINGGARENWPRAGLEAMAAGVPIVAQNEWGWREMIVHGETGFLANDDCELAHFAAMLAHDETLRMRIAMNARRRLKSELADEDRIWRAWRRLFEGLVEASSIITDEHSVGISV